MLTFLADIDIDGSIGGSLLFAIICAVIAPGRGRSALAWFFIGLFLSCIGLIILLLIPDLKEQEARERSRGKSVRRLKEQLKKERQVADQRHAAHAERLDAHDGALSRDILHDEAPRGVRERLAEHGPVDLDGHPAGDHGFAVRVEHDAAESCDRGLPGCRVRQDSGHRQRSGSASHHASLV